MNKNFPKTRLGNQIQHGLKRISHETVFLLECNISLYLKKKSTITFAIITKQNRKSI